MASLGSLSHSEQLWVRLASFRPSTTTWLQKSRITARKGLDISAVISEALRKIVESDTSDPAESQERRFEEELHSVDARLEKLEKEEQDKVIGSVLITHYFPGVPRKDWDHIDFRTLRFNALRDFKAAKKPEWANDRHLHTQIARDSDIIKAIRTCSDLAVARNERRTIEGQLKKIYEEGMKEAQ